jgi:hypothetical protein
MKLIDMIGHVDEQHQLHVHPVDGIRPGPVRVVVAPMTEQDAEDDWRAIVNSILARDWADLEQRGYAVDSDRFDNPAHIEQRVGRLPAALQGGLRTVLRYLYMSNGPTHLPPPRFKSSLPHLEPAEAILACWLRTRTDGRLKKRYGVNALKQARDARYRCEECGFIDVRALHLDHVHGLEHKVFACLCANCHNIKSRKHDWSGTKRYTEKEDQGA